MNAQKYFIIAMLCMGNILSAAAAPAETITSITTHKQYAKKLTFMHNGHQKNCTLLCVLINNAPFVTPETRASVAEYVIYADDYEPSFYVHSQPANGAAITQPLSEVFTQLNPLELQINYDNRINRYITINDYINNPDNKFLYRRDDLKLTLNYPIFHFNTKDKSADFFLCRGIIYSARDEAGNEDIVLRPNNDQPGFTVRVAKNTIPERFVPQTYRFRKETYILNTRQTIHTPENQLACDILPLNNNQPKTIWQKAYTVKFDNGKYRSGFLLYRKGEFSSNTIYSDNNYWPTNGNTLCWTNIRNNTTNSYILPLVAIAALYKLRPTIKPNSFLWEMRSRIQKFIPKKLLTSKYTAPIAGAITGLAINAACRYTCFADDNYPGFFKLHPANILWNTALILPGYYGMHWLMTYVEDIKDTSTK